MPEVEDYKCCGRLCRTVMIFLVPLFAIFVAAFSSPAWAQLSQESIFDKQLQKIDTKRAAPPVRQPRVAQPPQRPLQPQPLGVAKSAEIQELTNEIVGLRSELQQLRDALQNNKKSTPPQR